MFGFFMKNTFAVPNSRKLKKQCDKINKIRNQYLDYCDIMVGDANKFMESVKQAHDSMIDTMRMSKEAAKRFGDVYEKYSECTDKKGKVLDEIDLDDDDFDDEDEDNILAEAIERGVDIDEDSNDDDDIEIVQDDEDDIEIVQDDEDDEEQKEDPEEAEDDKEPEVVEEPVETEVVKTTEKKVETKVEVKTEVNETPVEKSSWDESTEKVEAPELGRTLIKSRTANKIARPETTEVKKDEEVEAELPVNEVSVPVNEEENDEVPFDDNAEDNIYVANKDLPMINFTPAIAKVIRAITWHMCGESDFLDTTNHITSLGYAETEVNETMTKLDGKNLHVVLNHKRTDFDDQTYTDEVFNAEITTKVLVLPKGDACAKIFNDLKLPRNTNYKVQQHGDGSVVAKTYVVDLGDMGTNGEHRDMYVSIVTDKKDNTVTIQYILSDEDEQ